jgi:hypothetical protein
MDSKVKAPAGAAAPLRPAGRAALSVAGAAHASVACRGAGRPSGGGRPDRGTTPTPTPTQETEET